MQKVSIQTLTLQWAFLLVLCFVTFSSAISDMRASRCEDLVMPLCRELWYNRTRMPNMFNHETQEEAGLQAHQFMHLVTIKCSPDLHFFLCSIYTPICVENYDKPLPPCRSICQRSKDGCTPLLRKYGFSWPAQMTCDQFPERSTDKQLCMERNISSTTLAPIIMKPTPPSLIDDDDVDHSLAKPLEVPKDNRSIQNDCLCSCRSPMMKINSIHHAYYNKVQTGDILNCAWPCRSPIIEGDKFYFISLWLSLSIALIFICCLSSLLTFVLNRTELIQAPHRFVAYMCCCQIGMSIGFIIRLVAGHYKTACYQPDSKPIEESLLLMLRFQNSAPSFCSISFLFTYFFFFASVIWWCLLCLTWFLNDGLGWSSSMLDKYSQLYHFVSWFFPGIFSMLALTMSAVDGDPVTGLCLVGNLNRQHLVTFMLAPLCVFICCGFFFLGCGFLSVRKCSETSSNRSKFSVPISSRTVSTDTSVESATSSLPQLNSPSNTKFFYGFLGLICSIPLCLTTGSIMYEMRWRAQWELVTTCSCFNQISPHVYFTTPGILLYILKYSGFFSMGIICGPWIWAMQTYKSWLGPIVRLVLCKKHSYDREAFCKSIQSHNCQSQPLYNTTYTITTSCPRPERSLEPSTTNDSLLMSSLNPIPKCQHRFPTSRLHDVSVDHSVGPETDSYASYQSLTNFNQVAGPQDIFQYYKSTNSMSRNWPIFH